MMPCKVCSTKAPSDSCVMMVVFLCSWANPLLCSLRGPTRMSLAHARHVPSRGHGLATGYEADSTGDGVTKSAREARASLSERGVGHDVQAVLRDVGHARILHATA